MSNIRYPNITTSVSQITVQPKESLTVFLIDNKGKSHQVELRVTSDGLCEVFVKDKLEVMDFSDWYPMPDWKIK